MPRVAISDVQRRLYEEHRGRVPFKELLPETFEEGLEDQLIGGFAGVVGGRGLRRVFKKYSKLSNLDDKHAERVLDKALDRAIKSPGGPKDPKGKESALRWALGYPSSKGHRYHKIPEQVADKSLSPRDAASIVRELDMDKTWAEGVLEDTVKGMKLK